MKLSRNRRQGATAPLLAVLMIVILAMVAFAVDVGWMVLVQSELQNSADAAALAGCGELGSGLVTLTNEKRNYYATNNTTMPTNTINQRKAELQAAEITSARSTAQRFAGMNKAGGVDSTIPNAQLSTDIQVGYTDSAGNTTWFSSTTVDAAQSPPVYSANWPNTVKATVRRDDLANNKLKLFFASVIGVNEQALSATATCSRVYITSPKTFTAGAMNGTILPLALRKEVWDTYFSQGKVYNEDGVLTAASDNFTRTYNGTISGSLGTPASDGVRELQIYPAFHPSDDGGLAGNFGQSQLVATKLNNATGNTSDWIRNGPTGADLKTFADADGTSGLVIPSGGRVFNGDPGLQSTLVSDFQAIVGQARLVPLYAAKSDGSAGSGGTGSNTWYNIVGFAAVTVVYAGGEGSNLKIMVQATQVNDPTAVGDTSVDGDYVIGPCRLQ